MERFFLKVVIILFCLVLLGFFASGYSEITLDEKSRKDEGGDYVRLKDGVVHYELAGPNEGEVVILIHGATVPSFGWDLNYRFLVESGFRVLRYDLFGRGFSDRPDLVYNEEPWDEQLHELIEKLDLKVPVNLVGLSLGGGIASIYTKRHPENVRSLTLIAPVGIPVNIPWPAKLAKLPIVGDLIMALIGNSVAASRFKETFFGSAEKYQTFFDNFESQLKYKGFKSTLLSMIRHYPVHDLREIFVGIDKLGVRSMLIWGEEDNSNPYPNHKDIKKLIPGIEFHGISKAAHSVQIEQASRVNKLLVDFFLKEQ